MNGSLNVLMFSAHFRPLVGGAERQVEKLAKALVAQGVSVTVLTPALVQGFPAKELDEGVTIRRFPLFDISRRLPGVRGFGPVNLLGLRWQLARVVNQHLQGASVLHANMAGPLTALAVEFAHSRSVPVVCKVGMAAGEQTDLTDLARTGTSAISIQKIGGELPSIWLLKTKLWDGGAPVHEKQSINAAIAGVWAGAGSSGVTIDVDTELLSAPVPPITVPAAG